MYHLVWIFPLYSDDNIYIKHCALRERKDYWSCWSWRSCLSTLFGSSWSCGFVGCFIVAPFVDSWSFIPLGPSTLIVYVPLPYGFYFWYTLLYGFIYKTFDHLTLWSPFTLWLYNLWTNLFTLLFLVFGPFMNPFYSIINYNYFMFLLIWFY